MGFFKYTQCNNLHPNGGITVAFFNDFKEIFTNAAQSVTNKTKDSVEITRLSSESRNITGEIENLYREIGRTYVDSKGTDSAALEDLCAKVIELRDRLDALERQKLLLRNQNRCPSCGAVMAKGARFCSNCGSRMPEPAPEPEPAPDADAVYCPECGAMCKDEDEFCGVCGRNLREAPGDEAVNAPAEEPVAPAAEDSADEAPTDFDAE